MKIFRNGTTLSVMRNGKEVSCEAADFVANRLDYHLQQKFRDDNFLKPAKTYKAHIGIVVNPDGSATMVMPITFWFYNGKEVTIDLMSELKGYTEDFLEDLFVWTEDSEITGEAIDRAMASKSEAAFLGRRIEKVIRKELISILYKAVMPS